MDIKFILLMIGIFFITIGYVNQNKYNCNVIHHGSNNLDNSIFDRTNISVLNNVDPTQEAEDGNDWFSKNKLEDDINYSQD
jgi:hypothetical protein